MIFGRHDLIQDAPISRIDLLLCRNTLMYFNAEAQARIMAPFHFSVNPADFCPRTRGDALQPHGDVSAVDLKRRIFKTMPQRERRATRLLLPAQSGREDELRGWYRITRGCARRASTAPTDRAAGPRRGRALVAANAAARRLFGLTADDIGGRCRISSCPTGRSSSAPRSIGPATIAVRSP